MRLNNTGRTLIHPVTHRIIHPGQFYEGPELGPDGQPVTVKVEPREAPKQGASPTVPPSRTVEKLDPAAWPDREALDDAHKADELKLWAAAQGLEFARGTTKGDLLDLIDQHRPKAPITEGAGQNENT